jgi:hypothetical protein
MKMTQLADVADPGGPAVGDVPTWVGTGASAHWEFQPPPPNPAGSVNVGPGITGTGASGTPIKVQVIGTTAGGATTGLEVYVDSAGNLRAVAPVAQAVEWSTILNKPTTFAPSAHKHPASDITDPLNLSVGDSTKISGKSVYVQSGTPTGTIITNSLWFW